MITFGYQSLMYLTRHFTWNVIISLDGLHITHGIWSMLLGIISKSTHNSNVIITVLPLRKTWLRIKETSILTKKQKVSYSLPFPNPVRDCLIMQLMLLVYHSGCGLCCTSCIQRLVPVLLLSNESFEKARCL